MIRLVAAFIAIVMGTLTAWSAGGPGALLYDMVKYAVATTPTTGAVTLSGAIAGFQVLTAAGGASGQLLSYSIIDTPTGWEVGRGTFLTSTSGATLTRTPLWSSNSNNAISASANAIVAVSALAEDMLIGESTGTLAARFNTTSQVLAIYNTADLGTALPANYERLMVGWTTNNVAGVMTQKGGNGTTRALSLTSGGALYFTEGVGGGMMTFQNFELQPTNANINLGDTGNPFGNIFIKNNRNLDFADGASINGAITVAASQVLEVLNGLGALGWWNWAGEARVTSDIGYTSLSTLTNVAGLSMNVVSGRVYAVEADVYFTDVATGGIQLALSGTLATNQVNYQGWIEDFPANGIKGGVNATSMGTAVANSQTSGTSGHAKLSGTISASGAGTLVLQAAQNTSNVTATTITRGSRLIVHDMP